jgi:hypothetical protein
MCGRKNGGYHSEQKNRRDSPYSRIASQEDMTQTRSDCHGCINQHKTNRDWKNIMWHMREIAMRVIESSPMYGRKIIIVASHVLKSGRNSSTWMRCRRCTGRIQISSLQLHAQEIHWPFWTCSECLIYSIYHNLIPFFLLSRHSETA